MRMATGGVAAGALLGVAAASYHATKLDADGVADRAYRLWFNQGQNRVDRGALIGGAVGGVIIPLFVSGQHAAGAQPTVSLLKTSMRGACLGLALGTLAAVALEATTKAVIKYSSRAQEFSK